MQHKHHWYRSNIVMFPFKVLIERGVPLDMAIVVDVPSIGSIFLGGIPLINPFIKKIPIRTSTAQYARQEEMVCSVAVLSRVYAIWNDHLAGV
jgi:hypothetical protein